MSERKLDDDGTRETRMTVEEMSSVMEFLYIHRAPSLPPRALSEVFDRLIWCLDDNGTALLRVREAWMSSADRGKVEIALAMDEVYPFEDTGEMKRVLGGIAAKWPDLAGVCQRIIDARAAEPSR